MPADPHVVLVCSAPWQLHAGAVAARTPVPCLVRALFADGFEAEVKATASAWSTRAVQVYFPNPDRRGPAYRVWVPVERVRRLPSVNPAADPAKDSTVTSPLAEDDDEGVAGRAAGPWELAAGSGSQ